MTRDEIIKNKNNLRGAYLSGAYLSDADLRGAYLRGACLENTKMPVHHFQVVPGGVYWKGINGDHRGQMRNNDFVYKLGMNRLPEEETFADDPRRTCSYPGLHIASREWVEINWRSKYLCKVQVPLSAKINNPWATDGKASVDRLKILKVYDMETGEDLTEIFKEDKNA